MNFSIKELPYEQLQQLGMSRKDLITLPQAELASMLNGGKSSVMELNLKLDKELGNVPVFARIGFERAADNAVTLKIYAMKPAIENEWQNTPEDFKRLQKGEIVQAPHKNAAGSSENYFFQLDKETNRIFRTPASEIHVPNVIKDIHLSLEQKEKLRSDGKVELTHKDRNEKIDVKLDLVQLKGYQTEVTSLGLKETTTAAVSFKSEAKAPSMKM